MDITTPGVVPGVVGGKIHIEREYGRVNGIVSSVDHNLMASESERRTIRDAMKLLKALSPLRFVNYALSIGPPLFAGLSLSF